MTDSIPHTLVGDCMTPFLITVTPWDTLARAYELMGANRIRRLPVVDGDRLVGIITLSDLLEVKRPDPSHRLPLEEVARELEKLTVGTVMAKDPVSVYANDTLGHAAELMLEHKIGGLPVLDGDGRLAGLLTESNVFRLLARRWREDNMLFSGAHSTGD